MTLPLFDTPKGVRRLNSLGWIFDRFEREPGYLCTKMFGCEAAYVDGLLCVVVSDRAEPWNGLLVCTSRSHHASLIEEMPALQPHAVLGKWLYISQDDPAFEEVAQWVTDLVLARDERVGVASKPRRR